MAVLPGAALAAEDACNSRVQDIDGDGQLGEGKVGSLPESQLGHVGNLLGIGHGDAGAGELDRRWLQAETAGVKRDLQLGVPRSLELPIIALASVLPGGTDQAAIA